MGTGATGLACIETGRDFIGIEINSEYYLIAQERVKQSQMQLKLLEVNHG
jgi:site-specific DNA-methyltransferase (adenine-specific)